MQIICNICIMLICFPYEQLGLFLELLIISSQNIGHPINQTIANENLSAKQISRSDSSLNLSRAYNKCALPTKSVQHGFMILSTRIN